MYNAVWPKLSTARATSGKESVFRTCCMYWQMRRVWCALSMPCPHVTAINSGSSFASTSSLRHLQNHARQAAGFVVRRQAEHIQRFDTLLWRWWEHFKRIKWGTFLDGFGNGLRQARRHCGKRWAVAASWEARRMRAMCWATCWSDLSPSPCNLQVIVANNCWFAHICQGRCMVRPA